MVFSLQNDYWDPTRILARIPSHAGILLGNEVLVKGPSGILARNYLRGNPAGNRSKNPVACQDPAGK